MRGRPAWGCSRATFLMCREYYSHECLSLVWGSSHFSTFKPPEFLTVSLGSFDSSYSSRTWWMRWQMASPRFSSLVITLPAIGQCCLPSILQVSIWLLRRYSLCGWPLVSSSFLSTLIASTPVLENGTDAAIKASSKTWRYYVLLHWHFTSADFDPPLWKK